MLKRAGDDGAVDAVTATDPVLAAAVERWGPPPLWRHPAGFAGLVHGILAQQVSLESAVAYAPAAPSSSSAGSPAAASNAASAAAVTAR
jgi:hypothetical protein